MTELTPAAQAAANLSAVCALLGDPTADTFSLAPFTFTLADGTDQPSLVVTVTRGRVRRPAELFVRCDIDIADDVTLEQVRFHVGRPDVTRRYPAHTQQVRRVSRALTAALAGVGDPQLEDWLTALRTVHEIREAIDVLANRHQLLSLVTVADRGGTAGTLAGDWDGSVPALADTAAVIAVPDKEHTGA